MAFTRAGIGLTVDEMDRLLEEVKNPLYKLMFKVAYLHGLRVSEVIGLTTKNIQGGYLSVQRLKGSQKTNQPLQSDTRDLFDEDEELNALVLSLKPGDKLFPITRFGAYKLIKRAGIRAGIPNHKLFPHVLKHSIAHQLIGPLGIEYVRQRLGHKSIASTGAYVVVSDDEVAKAVSAALHVAGEARK